MTIRGSLGPVCGSVVPVGLRLGFGLGLGFRLGLVRVRFADCCIQTAGESDKLRIN